MAISCLVCGRIPTDRAHVKTKKSGGTMNEWNLMPLCRSCHQTQHRIGIRTFVKAYPSVQAFLTALGWEWIESPGGYLRLWHPKER